MYAVVARIFLVAVVAVLGGCAASSIEKWHPLFAVGDEPYARVYFLRPPSERPLGVSDSPLRIEMGEKQALALAKGEYAVLHIKPGASDVIVRSLTYLTAQVTPVDVWRVRRYEFQPSRTYYVLLKQDVEEFRGIYFIPEPIDEPAARTLAQRLRPAGKLTQREPLAPP